MKLSTLIFCWLFLGSIGTFSIVWTGRCLARGEFLTAVVTIGVSAFCFGLSIPMVKALRKNVTPRGEFDSAGTTIRPDRGIDVPVQVAMLGLAVASVLMTVLVPLGRLDIPMPPSARYSVPFTCAVLAVTAPPMSWRMLRRGSTKYLRLTPDGFEIAQGWQPRGGNWAQVVDVTDTAPGQTAATPGAIVVIMSDGSAPTMAAGACTPDGRALRELVRFYWQHPEHRGELTDGDALNRMADELRRGPAR
jgi:hypothetical protein